MDPERKDPMLPLAGVRVIEFCNVAAGPYCAMLLADMGADVIKVEHPQGGDSMRQWPPLTGGYSVPAVAGGRLYVPTEDRKEEIVLCLDAGTGSQVWEFRYPCDYDPHTPLDQRY
jgi:crotonobetainyl-CoA:carnitine CoA-transferase CaiB-like acyl-CoA transferase